MADLNILDLNTPTADPATYPAAPQPAPASGANSLMFASMGLSALGAIATAFGQSRAARAQGDYEESISRTNAAIAGLQAKQALEAGDIEASRLNLKTQQTVGAIKAQQGASGVDVASGSSAMVRTAVAGAGATDELTIRNNAARQAWGYQTEALEDTYKGQFAQQTAKAQSEQSLMTGGLQAISGPLTMEANYLRFARYMDRYNAVGAGNSDKPFPMATG